MLLLPFCNHGLSLQIWTVYWRLFVSRHFEPHSSLWALQMIQALLSVSSISSKSLPWCCNWQCHWQEPESNCTQFCQTPAWVSDSEMISGFVEHRVTWQFTSTHTMLEYIPVATLYGYKRLILGNLTTSWRTILKTAALSFPLFLNRKSEWSP